jgi:hypothetical protein
VVDLTIHVFIKMSPGLRNRAGHFLPQNFWIPDP